MKSFIARHQINIHDVSKIEITKASVLEHGATYRNITIYDEERRIIFEISLYSRTGEINVYPPEEGECPECGLIAYDFYQLGNYWHGDCWDHVERELNETLDERWTCIDDPGDRMREV